AMHAAAGFGEGDCQRQSDIAGADDRDVGGHREDRTERQRVKAATSPAIRCDAWPSPYSGGWAFGGRRSVIAAATAVASSAASRFQPSSIVSTHSLESRSVMHGTLCR